MLPNRLSLMVQKDMIQLLWAFAASHSPRANFPP
jgi:hypothetical protein